LESATRVDYLTVDFRTVAQARKVFRLAGSDQSWKMASKT